MPRIEVHTTPGVSIDGAPPIVLQQRQAEILQVMAKSLGKPVSRESLAKAVWGALAAGSAKVDATLNAQIHYLRAALANSPLAIESIPPQPYPTGRAKIIAYQLVFRDDALRQAL